MKSGYYSQYFTRREMYASDTAARKGIDNTPPPAVQEELGRLCRDFLDNLRARFGPIRVTSGYRCPDLNAEIGGSSSSAHMYGRAADLQPLEPGVTLAQMVGWIMLSRLQFDQVIYEYGSWVHLGIASLGGNPRGQSLMIFRGTGYLPFDPNDPRVKGGG